MNMFTKFDATGIAGIPQGLGGNPSALRLLFSNSAFKGCRMSVASFFEKQ